MSAEPTPPSPDAAARPAKDAAPARRAAPALAAAFGATRVMIVVGVASLLIASATLLVFGAIETVRYIAKLVVPGPTPLTNREVFLASIKLVDLVLLSTIMQVVAIGLYCLFVDQDIPVPKWLRTTQVDQLKSKLAGIVAIMLGILFLEQVIQWGSDRDLLSLGIAIGAVIAALTYFIRAHPH